MKLPKYLTTVTPFSKFLAFILFITLPILFFYIGLNIGLGYNLKFMNPNESQQSNTGSVCQKGVSCTPTPTFNQILSPTPTCIPRPKCLDSNPRCMIAESSDMCPPSITPKACPNLAYKNSQGQTCTYSGPNCELICK